MFDIWAEWSSKLAQDQLEVMAVVLRRVWLRRNGVVFENKFEDPNQVYNTAAELLLEFQQAQSKQGCGKRVGTQCSGSTRWKPPNRETVKVNWDAALKIDENRGGIGVVIRDSSGEVLVSLCCPRLNVAEPVVAEVYALWRAMKLCEELNFRMVQLEGDALKVIQAVNKDEVSWEWHGQLIEELQLMLKSRRQWNLGYVSRSCNGVAHSLAKSALHVSEELVWIEDYPQEIKKLVDFDKLCNSVDS